ncbi:MAG: tetratricopeptide repeat protein [Burkholderiales bacterium]|nr:tetratricopeptide repeat protein [Burkholderiales bacterium]
MSRGVAGAAARAQDPLQHAVALQQRGATAEAMSTIDAVLQRQPRNWQALLLLGLMKLQTGDAQRASGLLARAAQLQPAHADTHFHLAQALQQLGDGEQAEASYRKAATLQPGNWLVHFHLGLLLEESGQTAAAGEAYARAVTCNGRSGEALNNLGNVLLKLGQTTQAEQRLRQAIDVNPALACAHLNLGMLLARDAASEREALAALEEAARLAPEDAQAHFHMGVLLASRHRHLQAIKAYRRTLELAPMHVEALNNLAVVHLEMWQDELAEEVLERALALWPGLIEGWNNLGNLRLRQERWREAREAYERALALDPDFAPALTGLGTALSENGDLTAARACYERALALDPTATAVLVGHAGNLQRLGDLEGALQHYHAARARSENDALRLKAALALRPILLSRDDIASQRARLERDVDALQEEGVQLSERELLSYPETCFYLAYHGEHDRDLLQKIARMMQSACPRLAYTAAHAIQPRAGQERLRIGFVSRFFYRHSVGRFFNPIIADLARREGFEVVLFTIGEKQDKEMQALAAACTKHVRLEPTSLEVARKLIEREQLDLLVYPEIGMDPFTWLLSFSRLARVQCVLQGHSNTSGVPALDYFVSSALIESDGAQHSERLLLPTLPMFLRSRRRCPHPSRRAHAMDCRIRRRCICVR